MLLRTPHALRVAIALLALTGTCRVSAQQPAAPAPGPAASAAPHRDGRFQNNYLAFEPRGFVDLLRWQIDAARQGLPRDPSTPIPQVAPNLPFIHGNAAAGAGMEPAVTWIGHASALVQMGGISLLTDPVFSERVSPLSFIGPKRHVPPALRPSDLPHIDAVLISHNHYDHLDAASVDALAAQSDGPPLFIVPLGLKAWFADRGITHVAELDWWHSVRVGEAEVMLVPSQHWSGRSLTDRMATLWGGYAVLAPDFHLYFAGDTAYSPDFADIHARLAPRHGGVDRGFDLALIPVGAYEPRWFMKEQHVNPAEAVQIHLDLRAQRSIGIHWGTFSLTDEALDEPPRALEAARRERGVADDAFGVMAVGETRRFPRRSP